jgi:tRNA threonylcarbamoyladenosine modification (KEOPS) complex  Pcc1 subunit
MVPQTASLVAEKLLIALSVAVAALVGLAPVTRFFGSPKLCLLFAAEGAIVSAAYLLVQYEGSLTIHRPGILESILRGIAAVCFWGFLGILWFLVYGGFYWLAKLIGLITGWLGLTTEYHNSSIPFYGSLVLALLFGAGIAVAIAQGTSRRLFSAKVSSRSVVYQKALQGQTRTLIYTVLSVAALGFMFFGLYRFSAGRGVGFYGFFQFIPYVACLWVLSLGVRIKKYYDVVSAFGQLLEIADYQVIFSPHSSDPYCDAVLSGLDMIAIKNRTALAIEVKSLSSSTLPVDWTTGSRLVLKAKALQQEELRQKLDIAALVGTEIQPLVVLVGRPQDKSLVDFAKEENLLVLTVDAEDLEQLAYTDNRALLELLAGKYFKYLEKPQGSPVGAIQESAV